MTNYKEFQYGCDGGCVVIGNADFQMHVTNDYGDGTHFIRVYDGFNSAPNKMNGRAVKFIGTACGTFNVYNYDCLDEEDLTDFDNILCTLCGKYAVYTCYGNIFLEKWE